VTKKPTKKKKPETVKVDKQAVTDLARCVAFALKFLDTKNGTGLRYDFATGKATVWQEDFMDALDKIGVIVDRDAYWKKKTKKTRGRK